MNCELPATGVATTASVLIAACLLVGGCGVLLWARRADRRALFCGVLVVVSAAGLATSHPTGASNNCVNTTAPPATLPPTTVASESSAPASTVPGTTIAATSTSTTTSPTTTTTTVVPTTVPVVAFCGTLALNDTDSLDVFISMEGGAGTYTALVPPSGACDGEVLDSGPAVDSNFFDPATFCAENTPGSTPVQAITAGTWTPSPPGDSWYACAPTG